MRRWILLLALLVPLASHASETRKLTVRGAGVIYGEVREEGELVHVVTITGEAKSFPKKAVLKNESMTESGPERADAVTPHELVVVGDSDEAPSPRPAQPPDGTPPPEARPAAGLAERIKNDPALLQELVSIVTEDPALAAALSDPAALAAAASGDPGKAGRSPLVRRLEENERFRKLVERLAAE